MRPSKSAGFALRTLADHKERAERPKCGFRSLEEKDYKSHSPRPNTQQKKPVFVALYFTWDYLGTLKPGNRNSL